MNKFVLLVCLVFVSLQSVMASDLALPHIQVMPIKDSQFDKQYELYIKLPDGYSDEENKEVSYPVIYFTDAMWHVEILSAATEFLMEDAILVGISWQKDIEAELLEEHGEHISRYRDYTISKSTNAEHQAKYKIGQANNHIAFIRNDVINLIEKKYRTQPQNRTYFGYSLGGLFGAYILASKPDTFKNYIIGSPSVWNDLNKLAEQVDKTVAANKQLNANVFITFGTMEDKLGKQVDRLIRYLRSKSDDSMHLHAEVIEGTHQTAFPQTAIQSLKWLANINQDHTGALTGPYMGQTPPAPGANAQAFAPGIISTPGWEVEGVFAPGMKEFYVTVDKAAESEDDKFSPTVIGYRMQDNVWQKYMELPRNGELVFSPDGNRMYLADGYRDRIGSGWSERKSLGPEIDRKDWGIMRLSASSQGTYVFDDYKGGDVIRMSTLNNGQRQTPEEMSSIVNTGKWTAHPYIAPDESYLIWDSERPEGFGGTDLYISFKQQDGSWGPAINMGETINTDNSDFYATVTSDGKYILFNRKVDDDRNIDIYWVDAQIIDTLRAKHVH